MPVPIGTAVFQWTTVAGLPAVGYLLYSYVAGSTTPLATYPTSVDAGAGTNANTNPTILDSLGSAIIWIPDGTTYKFVLTDTLGSTVWTVDNVSSTSGGTGGGGVSGEWVASGMTPTYISVSSFSVTGDQRATFDVSRKIKATVTAGTYYGTVVSSTFSTFTTVNVIADQGSILLDSGISAVSYGADGVNRSIPTASSMFITGGSPGAMSTTVAQTQLVTAASPSAQVDVLSEFTASNGRFTAKNSGVYLVYGQAALVSTGVTFSGNNSMSITRNGGAVTGNGTFGAGLAGGSLTSTATVEALILLTAGDFINLTVTPIFSAGAPTVNSCTFEVRRIA